MGDAAEEVQPTEVVQEPTSGPRFDDGVDDTPDVAAEAPTEQTTETAPEPEPAPAPKVEFTPEQQEVVNNIIASKVAKTHEERRAREELERRLAEIQGQQPQDSRPTIPPIPDPYDLEFDEKVAARDEAIRKAAAWDARQDILAQREAERVLNQQQQAQERLAKVVQSYDQRANELGIAEQDLATAGISVMQYGIRDDIAAHILEDDKGPMVTMHLARNLTELDKLNSMSPMKAAIYVETQIKPKLVRKTNVSNAPEPPDTLSGGGAPANERGPKGARFE